MEINIKQLEEFKEKQLDIFMNSIDTMYRAELDKIFVWFKEKFPKRILEYVDGMGTNFFVIDGDILSGRSEYEQERIRPILKPLFDFIDSIQDSTNSYGFVCIGDKRMDRFATSKDGCL